MAAVRQTLVISVGTLLAAAILPASMSHAAERIPMLSYDFTGMAPSAPIALDAATAENAPALQSAAQVDDASLDCLAKVVHHEARNQPRSGQVAVAQTLINRMKAAGGRFGSTICAVANQRGQYFNTASYRPREDDTWDAAVDVARNTLSGEEAAVVPGAIFFRAAYSPQNTFFRSRQRVAAVGDHVFYR